jgi:hypothetical protein
MATDLITKLEEAGEGSRELDKVVWIATGGWSGVDAPPSFTTSLDAALALAERVLDLHCAVVESSPQSDHPNGQKACASVHLVGGGGSGRIAASTPALALCAAILRASEEKQS